MNFEVEKDGFLISTDPGRLDFEAVYGFLSGTYWGRRRTREIIEKSFKQSLCFGLYRGPEQAGFGRAVTDYATFAYLADVYVLEQYRRRGLGKWLINSILEHPELKQLRRWCLVTQDAQPLYKACGFRQLEHPEEYMELLRPYPVETTHASNPP